MNASFATFCRNQRLSLQKPSREKRDMPKAEGLKIAKMLIAKEARENTGTLDLGNLNLTEFPNEIFQLDHLRVLNLGGCYCDSNGKWHDTANSLHRNHFKPNTLSFSFPMLQVLSLRATDIEGSMPDISSLTQLEVLDIHHTFVHDISVLTPLKHLRVLYCSATWVSDLSALKGLMNLRSLVCWSCSHVADLSPLKSLKQLQEVNCNATQVTDLSPLTVLPDLQLLNCGSTNVTDLSLLESLKRLQMVDCSSTKVTDLSPLANIIRIQTLNCSSTKVTDLAPLAGLKGLKALNCSSTSVKDLSPLAKLKRLQKLDCSSTEVADLSPLIGLDDLQVIDCSATSVTDLSPLVTLRAINEVCAAACTLYSIPLALLERDCHFYLRNTQIPGVPPAVLSKCDFPHDDCRDKLLKYCTTLVADYASAVNSKSRPIPSDSRGNPQVQNWLLDRAHAERAKEAERVLNVLSGDSKANARGRPPGGASGQQSDVCPPSQIANESILNDSTAESNDADLLSLWDRLLPEQRRLLGFIQKHEGNRLTFLTIAANFTIPSLAGANVDDPAEGHTLSDRPIRRYCRPMFESPYCFLEREGDRGPIRLTIRGRRLVSLVTLRQSG